MSGNEGMANMIQTINFLQDRFNPLGINLALDLPQIAVVGGQSAGKSSVLENFVGEDFLPRGSGIVTRRPLILQLINDQYNVYGEFLHIPGKKFYKFNEIRKEIEAETEREVGGRKGISSSPINLKIYSPNVVDLTLIDLPGLTKVPVEDPDIEYQIKKMIFSYITRDNCLILAVTAANQDLATSDALQLAKEADPEGKRTIGVLTKMDLMDDGTNARDILDGKLLPLKRGYIGVINRSQKDIDSRKNISEALSSERKFFSNHPDYSDILNRLGTTYLQNYLNKELSQHIFKQLPSLRDMFESKFNELEDRLSAFETPEEIKDFEKILSELNEQLRRDFELAIGRSASVRVDIKNLSGGTRINSLMNEKYPNEITAMFYDENKLRREIAVSIQNIHGAHLGIFTPDMAFEAVIRNQIEQFRLPSLRCVDWVTRELENVIRDCVSKIERLPRIREIFGNTTLKHVRECQKDCKSRMQYMVDVQLAYMNTIHEDFQGINSEEVMLPSYDNPKSQFAVSQQLSAKQTLERSWIKCDKKDFWFVLNTECLIWYKDVDEKDKKGSINLNDFQIKRGKDDKTLIISMKKSSFMKENNKELIFKSNSTLEKWKESFEMAGVKSISDDNGFYSLDSDSDSLLSQSVSTLSNGQLNGHSPQMPHRKPQQLSREELELPTHLRPQVEVVKKLVDSYVKILKKTFKDYLPKLIMLALIEATKTFIAVDLKLRIREFISSPEDMLGGDPDEELRKSLTNQMNSYKEAIAIIDHVLIQK